MDDVQLLNLARGQLSPTDWLKLIEEMTFNIGCNASTMPFAKLGDVREMVGSHPLRLYFSAGMVTHPFNQEQTLERNGLWCVTPGRSTTPPPVKSDCLPPPEQTLCYWGWEPEPENGWWLIWIKTQTVSTSTYIREIRLEKSSPTEIAERGGYTLAEIWLALGLFIKAWAFHQWELYHNAANLAHHIDRQTAACYGFLHDHHWHSGQVQILRIPQA